ncbi:MAG: DUF5667 domain-containing protein [Patescibacteria group bacterium]|nr:DUF5667 domain-containing protein [Patescibacteria group bacterium]
MIRRLFIAIFCLLFIFIFPQVSVYAVLSKTTEASIPSITLTPTPSVEYTLPYPGILPDSPLYFLKVLRDHILLFFTKDSVRKVQLNLLFSDKRLVMGQQLWDKNEYNLSIDTITKGEKYLLTAAVELNDIKKTGDLPPGLADKLDLAAKKHEEIINGINANSNDKNYSKRLLDALGVTHQAIQQISASR